MMEIHDRKQITSYIGRRIRNSGRVVNIIFNPEIVFGAGDSSVSVGDHQPFYFLTECDDGHLRMIPPKNAKFEIPRSILFTRLFDEGKVQIEIPGNMEEKATSNGINVGEAIDRALADIFGGAARQVKAEKPEAVQMAPQSYLRNADGSKLSEVDNLRLLVSELQARDRQNFDEIRRLQQAVRLANNSMNEAERKAKDTHEHWQQAQRQVERYADEITRLNQSLLTAEKDRKEAVEYGVRALQRIQEKDKELRNAADLCKSLQDQLTAQAETVADLNRMLRESQERVSVLEGEKARGWVQGNEAASNELRVCREQMAKLQKNLTTADDVTIEQANEIKRLQDELARREKLNRLLNESLAKRNEDLVNVNRLLAELRKVTIQL